jgi:late competence protein required for DNA uptake (superfamily II DNA/RNA helicase)
MINVITSDAPLTVFRVFFPCRSLIDKIKKHDNVIIVAETGSGKTTQIPQYILEAGLNEGGCIAVTQVRTDELPYIFLHFSRGAV